MHGRGSWSARRSTGTAGSRRRSRRRRGRRLLARVCCGFFAKRLGPVLYIWFRRRGQLHDRKKKVAVVEVVGQELNARDAVQLNGMEKARHERAHRGVAEAQGALLLARDHRPNVLGDGHHRVVVCSLLKLEKCKYQKQQP